MSKVTPELVSEIKRGNLSRISEILLQHADLEVKDGDGYTALIMASSLGKTEIVRLLLDKGADPNAQDNTGSTALIRASRVGYATTVELLLRRGADPNIRDSGGRTALERAKDWGRMEVVQLIEAWLSGPRPVLAKNPQEYPSERERIANSSHEYQTAPPVVVPQPEVDSLPVESSAHTAGMMDTERERSDRESIVEEALVSDKIYAKKFSSEDGASSFCLLSFNGRIRDDLLKRFNENYNVRGAHVDTGGAISPLSMLTLLGSGTGALALSSALSGQLFMATANPATLMAIGSGVGSAVMGAGGIVAQAPFIPVAGAMMPIAAPLLAFTAISTVMIMKQFKGIHDKLNHIEEGIHRIIQRSEAAFVGEIISAAKRIDDLEEQFRICKCFTSDMIIRLSVVEDKVNPIFERYSFLYRNQSIGTAASTEDLGFKENDAYFAILLSILDLRIDRLRLRLAIQDNPGYMTFAAERLAEKVEHYRELWKEIESSPNLVYSVRQDILDGIEEMNWWQKRMPSWLFGKRKERKQWLQKASQFEERADKIRRELGEPLEQAKLFGQAIDRQLSGDKPVSLLYWRDHLGEHSYYTEDIELLPAHASISEPPGPE